MTSTGLFHLKERGTSFRCEVLAGITTFATMAYIIFVNPAMLQQTGMNASAVMMATIVASAAATLLMGFVGNYPFALAPGMGLNAFFTYSLVLGEGVSWQQALGVVFCSAVIMILLTGSKVRSLILEGIPPCIRFSATAGIGLFLAFIGLKNADIIIAHPATFVQMGPMGNTSCWMTLVGVVLTIVLMRFRIRGALFFGILVSWLVALALGVAEWKGLVAAPPSLMPTFMQLDILGIFSAKVWPLVIPLVFISLFDSTGTFLGLAQQGKFLDSQGKLLGATRALYADGTGSLIGALLGTSTVTTFLESGSGIAAGGRTGLTAVVVALLFLATMFFEPVAMSIPLFATAPALIIIGALMMQEARHLDWGDPTEFVPAFLVIIGIPFTYSIAKGIELGLLAYPLAKLLTGRGREIHWIIWVLAAAFTLLNMY